MLHKVQFFWEGHKNLRKTMRTIGQIFVAFLEKLNFISNYYNSPFSF